MVVSFFLGFFFFFWLNILFVGCMLHCRLFFFFLAKLSFWWMDAASSVGFFFWLNVLFGGWNDDVFGTCLEDRGLKFCTYMANTFLYSGMELSTLHHVPGVHREQHPGGPQQVTKMCYIGVKQPIIDLDL